MLDRLDKTEHLQWNHKVTKIACDDSSNRHALFFADGSSTTVNVVVGADGAWSKVQPLLSTAQPEYTSVTFVEAIITDVDACPPDIAKLAG